MSDIIEEKEIELELDLDKFYSLPNEIKIIKHNNVYLAIYTEGISWIILQDEEEKSEADYY